MLYFIVELAMGLGQNIPGNPAVRLAIRETVSIKYLHGILALKVSVWTVKKYDIHALIQHMERK
jgi:hypothetical protein